MEFNWTTIGIFVAVWLVGYLLGLLESSIKNDKKEAKEKNASEGEELEEGVAPATASSEAKEFEPEVLAVFERMSGALKIRLDGEIIDYKSDLIPEQRARLLALVVSLRPWLEGTKAVNPSPPLPVEVKVAAEPKPAPKVDLELDTDADAASFSHLSMVEQINRVLQKKLEEHPLNKRGISLGSALDGGLLVKVGLNKYDNVEEVPEQEIQDIIHEAIAEWDAKVLPN